MKNVVKFDSEEFPTLWFDLLYIASYEFSIKGS